MELWLNTSEAMVKIYRNSRLFTEQYTINKELFAQKRFTAKELNGTI